MANRASEFYISKQCFLFRNNDEEVFLPTKAEWRNNAGLLTTFGGKMKGSTDITSLDCICREKWEELGDTLKIQVLDLKLAERLTKKDGEPSLCVEYYYAEYQGGRIKLSLKEFEKYSKADWKKVSEVLKADASYFVHQLQDNLSEVLEKKKALTPEFIAKYSIEI